MPKDERVIAVVREWIEKADNDLKNAAYILTLGAEGPTDTVCFHSQQCVEKYLKAVGRGGSCGFTSREIPSSRSHSAFKKVKQD